MTVCIIVSHVYLMCMGTALRHDEIFDAHILLKENHAVRYILLTY